MDRVSDCINCERLFECDIRGVKHGCLQYKERKHENTEQRIKEQ